MCRLVIMSVLITMFAALEVQAQIPPQTPSQTASGKTALDPQRLAEEWLRRYNALDDWHLTVEGKEEGLDELVNSMMELYAPDVLAEVPPNDDDQIGPVMLRGSENTRKWVEKLARSYVRLEFIHKRQTMKEFEGLRLVYSTPLPWGGLGISFEITGVYSLRQDRRRFMAPGTVFLQFREDGKIQRIRLYLTETAEVVQF